MATSRLTIRLIALAVGIAVIWYITHLHGEIADLRAQLASSKREPARPSGATAPAPAAAPAAKAPVNAPAQLINPRVMTPEERTAMVDKLSGGGMNKGTPVWFATVPGNPEAAAFQKVLESIFTEAGWVVKANSVVGFPMKAGIYVFAAEENPPDYVETVNAAFEAAHIPLASSGRGYREYYKQKKDENPNWIGFEMAPDQTYVVVVGRRPEDATPTP